MPGKEKLRMGGTVGRPRTTPEGGADPPQRIICIVVGRFTGGHSVDKLALAAGGGRLRISARSLGLATVLCLLGGGDVAAAVATWTDAAGDSAWANAANWTPAPPTSADTISFATEHGARVVRAAGDGGCAAIDTDRDAEITGAPLHLAQAATCQRGRLALACGIVLDGDVELQAEAGTSIDLAASDLGAHQLGCGGEGRIRIGGALVGAGGLTCRGPGRVELAAASGFRGAAALLGGETWLLIDALPDHDGGLGNGHDAVLIDGGCLVDGAEHLARALAIGEHGGRIDAVAKPRVIASAIDTGTWAGGGLVGTYLNHSLRAVVEDDWRKRPEVGGTREDKLIHFPSSAYGTAAERAKFRIAGADDNWDDFSVQWDGWLRVERDGTTLYTCSDDGSRVWIDLDHDGKVAPSEWGSNGWGGGQGATLRKVHGPLKAGVYRFRVQHEDGGGPNCCSLLWDDAQHSGGAYSGQQIVPAKDYVRAPSLTVGGDDYGEQRGQPLTLTGPISGSGQLAKVGASELRLAGAGAWSGGTRVDAGLLIAAAEHALPAKGAVRVGERGRVTLRAPQAMGAPEGDGRIDLDAAATVDCDEDATYGGTLQGAGTLLKLGRGRLTLRGPVTCPVEARDGSVVLADGRLMTGVKLASPLTTTTELPPGAGGPRAVELTVVVPADAPRDLGCGASVGDRHGHWFQAYSSEPLTPGTHRLTIALDDDACLRSEPSSARWDATAAATSGRTAVFFWSATTSRAVVRIDARVVPTPRGAATKPRLLELALPAAATLRTGERLEWTCRPEPFPVNPYDPEDFALDAVFTAPDQRETRVPAFYFQRMRGRDRGDRDEVLPSGGDAFATRFRARVPGHWQARWEARWCSGSTQVFPLPAFDVAGEPWDDYVRVDKQDPRFFATGGDFYWPIGLNLHCISDPRDQACLGTKRTPERGVFAYEAYFSRLAAAGGTGTEIWMAPWNLGLEWRGDWNGFYGQGRYGQENAWRLDQVLDRAWAHGIRVNLVVTNHGQASEGADPEWTNSCYNKANGGRIERAAQYFTDAWALRGQENYRRYIIARYADHPAIIGWKLWSEVNLTQAGEHVVEWHERACARWHALDAYGHPTSSHWAGDWNSPDRRVVALPGLDYVCIDQYHQGNFLAEMLAAGGDPQRGLAKYKKPIVVTEFGGNWNAGPHDQIMAEQAYAPWAAFVTGYAAAPMTWWFEFVDQHELWRPYGAIARFVAGEDLRGAGAASLVLNAPSAAGALWCHAWRRGGRDLGYVIDADWGRHGGAAKTHDQARIELGVVPAGELTVEWWDADQGAVIGRDAVASDGQAPLALSPPAFQRHLGFKVWRTTQAVK
jgi:autotransporter-associated beta strand protein